MSKKKEEPKEETTEKENIEKYCVKHLVECNCILPQFRNLEEPVFHKFVVLSVVDENNEVEEKYVQCNNCMIVHKVYEIGKSQILKEEMMESIRTIDDIKVSLPNQISEILKTNDCDLPTYEQVEFILENELWDSEVIIKKQNVEDKIIGKILTIRKGGKAKISNFTNQDSFKF